MHRTSFLKFYYYSLPALLWLLLSSSLHAQLASPGVIYASTSDGKIYELNQDYSQKHLVVQTELADIRSMAINSKGEVYAVDRDSLYAIDLSTGAAAAITAGPTPQSQFSAIAFDQSDQLFVIEATINSAFWYNLLTYNFESAQFEMKKSLSNNDDAFVPSLAVDPYTSSPYYFYKHPSFDEGILGSLLEAIYLPLTSHISGVKWGLLHFDFQGRLVVIEENRINWVDRFSANVYAREKKETFSYSSVASMLPAAGSLRPVIIEAAQLVDFDEVATGGYAENRISVSNMGDEEISISFSTTESSNGSLELPEPATLAPGGKTSLQFILHVKEEGTVAGDLNVRYGAAETETKNLQYQAIGFDVHPINSEALYAITRNGLTHQHELKAIDFKTKKATQVSTLSKPIEMLAANSKGVLYGIKNDSLYLVDAQSGRSQKLNWLGFPPRSMAFDLADSLYLPYIDEEDGWLFYVELYKYDPVSSEIESHWPSSFWTLHFSPEKGQIAVSATGEIAILGDDGLAIGTESQYISGSPFPEEQLLTGLSGVKDIAFYKDGSLFGYDTSLGRINLETGTFDSFSINIAGFVGFVKAVPPLNILGISGAKMVAYPNPLSESLTVLFEIEKPSVANLEIFSVNGQLTVFIEQEFPEAGEVEIRWNGRDASGNRLKEGSYFLRLVVNGDVHAVQRLIVAP